MKKVKLSLWVLLFYSALHSQISNVVPNSLSTANAGVSDMQRWSAFASPASLATLKGNEAGFQFENRYLLSELSTRSMDAAFTSKYFNTGISASYFGFSAYHEMMIGLGFARDFSSQFSLGVQFNYFNTYFSDSERYIGVLFPQVGLQVRLSPVIHLGFSVFNPFQTHIHDDINIKRLPSVFSLGGSYFFSNDLVLRAQLDKELSSNYRFAAGLEYTLLENIRFQAGIWDAGYMVSTMGFSFDFGQLSFDLHTGLHPLLGLISAGAVRYRFYKK